jgi:predicted permease
MGDTRRGASSPRSWPAGAPVKRRDRDLARQIDAEIRAHIALRTEELIAGGLDPDEARAEAERRFGGVEESRRRLYRSARRREGSLRLRSWLDNVSRDFGLALRRIRQAPGFAALAIAIFGLGIGLSTATFTVVERVLLRPLPFPEPDRLVALHSMGEAGNWFPYVSQGNWVDWKERNNTLAATAIHHLESTVTVMTPEGAFFAPGAIVGGAFFEVVGMPMHLGRAFTEEESQAEAPVAVVSQGFWERVMGADPGLDTELFIQGQSREIVGVVPAGLEFPQGTDVWLPYRYRPQTGAMRNNINWFAVARLRPGVSIREAGDDLGTIAAGIRASDPAGVYSWGVHVEPLHERLTGRISGTLTLLMSAVGFVFLLACANLAGINFARSSARRQEIAVRVALGAGRLRIIQQQIVENLVLALLGGGLGVLLAWRVTATVSARLAEALPRTTEIAVDGWVLAFAVLASLLAGALAGLAPAINASGAAPKTAMAAGARFSGGAGRGPATFLVAGEIALAVLLLTGAGLLLRSFTTLVGRELGFEPRGVVVADIAASSPRLLADPSNRVGIWEALLERFGSLSGIASVAVANPPPAGDGGNGWVAVEGRPDLDLAAEYRAVSDDYFETLEIPLLAGRPFDSRDAANGQRVVIVSRAAAETFWPGEDPLGRRIRATSMEAPEGSPWLTVIGVAEDVRNFGFDSDVHEAMYILFRQVPRTAGKMALLVRGAGGSDAALMGVVREQIGALDDGLAAGIDTLDNRLAGGVSGQRTTMSVLGSFAALALLLAAIGIYALQSFAVAQRTQEIAVRTALGASQAVVLRGVVGGAARIAVAGTAAGLLAAWWLTGLLEAFLVDVSPRDPWTFIAVAATLLATAAAAAVLPAWRAARLDPLQALRRT